MTLLGAGFFTRTAIVVASTLALAACGGSGDATLSEGAGGGPEITGAGGSTTHALTASSVASSSSATAGTGGAAPSTGPYPFVLAHGFFGFEEFAGLDFETYFYGVKDRLAKDGEIVDTPTVDPFNDSDYRGQQLLARVQDFLAATGASKVNLIGHSQGGLDARVVANLRPDLVASVVTVATPHHGSPIGDIAMKLLANPNSQQIIDDLVKLVGAPLYDQVGDKTSITKAFELFSQPGITAFNKAHPDSPGVFYASIAGRSSLHWSGGDCTPDKSLPFISGFDSNLDPIDPALSLFGVVLSGTDDTANDGLVRVKDGRWGEFWGCVPADHLDEIGQLLGDDPGLGNDWNHLDFYSALIKYIRSRGF